MSSGSSAEVEEDDGVGVVGALVEEGDVREEQHPVGRGGGGEHPTSGVADDEHLRAAIRGVLGVGPNSVVGENGVEFLALGVTGIRCPRRPCCGSSSSRRWPSQCVRDVG